MVFMQNPQTTEETWLQVHHDGSHILESLVLEYLRESQGLEES